MYVFSAHRSQIKWRPVVWGVVLQFVGAVCVLRIDAGRAAFFFLSEQVRDLLIDRLIYSYQVNGFLRFTEAGSNFVYGHLSGGTDYCVYNEGQNRYASLVNPVFAFSVLSTVIFFSSFIALLYHIGILQFVIKRIAQLLSVRFQSID